VHCTIACQELLHCTKAAWPWAPISQMGCYRSNVKVWKKTPLFESSQGFNLMRAIYSRSERRARGRSRSLILESSSAVL
jgi:hypothetical protein